MHNMQSMNIEEVKRSMSDKEPASTTIRVSPKQRERLRKYMHTIYAETYDEAIEQLLNSVPQKASV